MEIIPQLIKNYATVLYAVCGIACLYFVFTGLASLRELQRAVFRLERSAVMSRAVGAWLKALLCIVAAGVVFAISSLAPARTANSLLGDSTTTPNGGALATSMPTAEISAADLTQAVAPTVIVIYVDGATPTVDMAATPTVAGPEAAAPAPMSDPNAQPAPTATELPTPTPTPEAPAQPSIPIDCSNSDAQIVSPAANETIAGVYTVRGTAVVEAGGFYKLEILMPGAVQWSFMGRGDSTVQNGELLSNFNFSAIPPGVYAFRLVTVQANSNIAAICQIPIVIGQ